MSSRIFWSYWGHSNIVSADKMTGSNIRVEYDLTGHKIADIFTCSVPITPYPLIITYVVEDFIHAATCVCRTGYRYACTTGIMDTCNSGMHH